MPDIKMSPAVIAAVGTANGYLGAALSLISMYRAARDAVKAQNPELPDGTFPPDEDLISLFKLDADAFVQRTTELEAKWKAIAAAQA